MWHKQGGTEDHLLQNPVIPGGWFFILLVEQFPEEVPSPLAHHRNILSLWNRVNLWSALSRWNLFHLSHNQFFTAHHKKYWYGTIFNESIVLPKKLV
jgi:hypothetical protein